MSQISKENQKKCSFCNEIAPVGGYHLGDPNLAICGLCVWENGLHILGYLIGDAIADTSLTTRADKVQEIILKLEKEIWKAIVKCDDRHFGE